MIGVFLTRRRREFFEFASQNPIDYQEILDPTDTNSLSLYKAIFSDGSAGIAEPFSVIDISTANFSEVFAPYIKQHKPERIFPEELFYSALFYYYEQTQCGCLQTFIPPTQNTRATFEDKGTQLPIREVNIEKKQDDEELASLVDDVEAKPDFHADLTKKDLHVSLAKEPEEMPFEPEVVVKAPDFVKEEVIEDDTSMYTEVFPVEQEAPVTPPPPTPRQTRPIQTPVQQPYPVQTPVQQSYPDPNLGYAYQQSGFGYPQMPNPYGYQQQQPMPNPYGYPQQQPMPGYGQPAQGYGGYPAQPQMPVGLNPFGTPVQPEPQVANPLAVASPQRMPVRSGGTVQVRRRGSSAHKRIGAPIITFSSLTDKAGTTTVAFLLAKAMASKDFNAKILYLDLNISNPNTISNFLGFTGMTDASIINIATANEIDFASNLALLTETVQANDSSFSMITFGEATFRQKTGFSAIDYSQFLSTLADSFDTVLVDIGKLQGTMPYQQLILNSSNAKHIIVADGSTARSVNTFISNARGLMHSFEIVVNKSAPNVGTFAFDRMMHITPLAAIGYHNNTARFITDAMPFDGTAMQSELCALGGAL